MRHRLRRWASTRLREGLLFLAAAAAVASTAWGATYNFYFNNMEQGDNGQATPTVLVGPSPQPGIQQAQVAPAPEAAPVAPVTATPEGPAPAASQAVAIAPDPAPSELRRVRLTFAAAGVWQNVQESYSYEYAANGYSYTSRRGTAGGLIGLGAYLSRGVALSGYFGAYEAFGGGASPLVGADLELVPLRLSLGKWADAIEGALLLGASTFRRAEGNWVALHAGARLSFNFGSAWGVTAAARANLGSVIGEAGLVVRL